MGPLQSIILFYVKMGKKIGRKAKRPDEKETQLYDTITKIETEILAKIQKLKRLPKLSFCDHINIQSPFPESYEQDRNYFDHFWKGFLRNQLGKSQIQKIQKQITYLSKRISILESLFQQRELQMGPLRKYRMKQYKNDVFVQYQCPSCTRSYNDQETLILHQQIKHSDPRNEEEAGQPREDIFESDEDQENLS